MKLYILKCTDLYGGMYATIIANDSTEALKLLAKHHFDADSISQQYIHYMLPNLEEVDCEVIAKTAAVLFFHQENKFSDE